MSVQTYIQDLLQLITEDILLVKHKQEEEETVIELASQNKKRKKNQPTQRSILPLVEEAGLSVISSHSPAPSVSVSQIRALKQNKNDSCGYYALFNIIETVCAITAEDKDKSLDHLSRISNRTRFWFMYTKFIAVLKDKSKREENKTYPWTVEHVEKGMLERPYIDYLLWYGKLQEICDLDLNIMVLSDFSMNYLKHNQLPVTQIQKLHQIFEDIKKNKNTFHAFLIGQICHWICIICNKVEDHLEIILFDSRNHNLIEATDEELQAIMREDGKEVEEYMKEIYMLSLKEPKLLVKLFHDCIADASASIMSRLLSHNMEGFLESFEENVQHSDADLFLAGLLEWLDGYWPPPVINQSIIRILTLVGVKHLSEKVKHKFVLWIKCTRKHVDLCASKMPIVKRFEKCIEWFEREFSVEY